MDDKLCRIAVFYDGTYFNKVSNYYLFQHERRARISIKGLHDFIAAEVAKAEAIDVKHCRIVDASYFRGRFTAQQAFDQDRLMSERIFEDVLMRADITMFQQHLTVHSDGTFEEKRIDVWLALEAYEMATLKRYDVCVLLTGDGDFVPLVRKLNTLGSRVMLLGWDFSFERDGRQHRTYVSTSLIDRVNYPVMMDTVIDGRDRRTDPLVKGLFMDKVDIRDRRVDSPVNSQFVPKPVDSPTRQITRTLAPAGDDRQGIVVSLLPEKGFGFIKPSGGGDNIFFHATEVVDIDFTNLSLHDAVIFTLGYADRGPVARKVRLDISVKDGSDSTGPGGVVMKPSP